VLSKIVVQAKVPDHRSPMLSPDDADLARRDRAIPGLATLFDNEAFIAALHSQLPGINVQGVRQIYVHYKPGRRCLVLYRIQANGTELLAYADAYGPDAQVKLPKVRELHTAVSPLGFGAQILEATDTAFYVFPTDRKLRSLRRLAEPDDRMKLLRRVFPEQSEYCKGTFQHLRYKPERRYVARLDTPAGPKALIKFYNPARYAAAKAGMLAFKSRGALGLAPGAGCSDQDHVLAFEWLSAQHLHTLLIESDVTADEKAAALELTGAALAELHAQTPDGLRHRTRENELMRLQAQANTITQLCPELTPTVEQLVPRITAQLSELQHVIRSLHGDFYDQQVMLGSDGTAIILDIDQAELGDPAADLGLFIAHLEREELRNTLSAQEVGAFSDALIQGYCDVCRSQESAAIHLYTAIGLLYLAAEPFRYREPEWPAQIEAMLMRTDKLLAVGSHLDGRSSSHARSGR
jgi:aminoglycoside phosphotransferase (APT) family kinase protein